MSTKKIQSDLILATERFRTYGNYRTREPRRWDTDRFEHYFFERFFRERPETKSLLGHPNIETAIGKRDYAIMTIASQTGLRAVDIKNLKRSDIDWRTNEIRIIQHKTKRALSIPLRTEMGNAIADYLLHGRPESSIPNIFLCAKSPIRPLGDYTISHIVTTHMKCAGVAKKTRRGSHSFRRSFGKKLLVAETSLDMLSELLGHTNINSSKTYAAINERELKMCALSLSFIRKENE